MPTRHQLVSIYLSEADQWENRPLYLQILDFLSSNGCSGATVLRGFAGFTAGTQMATASAAGSEGKLPVVVQLIEAPAKITEVLPTLRKMAGKRLITLQDTQVVHPQD